MLLSLDEKVLENATTFYIHFFVKEMLSYWQKSRQKHGMGEHMHVCTRRIVYKHVHVQVVGEINRPPSPKNNLTKTKHRFCGDTLAAPVL